MTGRSNNLQLYLAHRPALIDYAMPIVGSRATAEDVVQEAFLRFEPVVDQPISKPVAYLYRIVRNLALDWTRQLAVERRRLASHGIVARAETIATPEDRLLHRDQIRRVADVLDTLPENTRVAFEMYRFEGATLQDVANRLGVSVATAHRMVRDALMRCAGAV